MRYKTFHINDVVAYLSPSFFSMWNIPGRSSNHCPKTSDRLSSSDVALLQKLRNTSCWVGVHRVPHRLESHWWLILFKYNAEVVWAPLSVTNPIFPMCYYQNCKMPSSPKTWDITEEKNFTLMVQSCGFVYIKLHMACKTPYLTRKTWVQEQIHLTLIWARHIKGIISPITR